MLEWDTIAFYAEHYDDDLLDIGRSFHLAGFRVLFFCDCAQESKNTERFIVYPYSKFLERHEYEFFDCLVCFYKEPKVQHLHTHRKLVLDIPLINYPKGLYEKLKSLPETEYWNLKPCN